MHSVIKGLLFCLTIFYCLPVFAQKTAPALEQPVTLRVQDEPVSEVLQKITQQTQIKFSYNPARIQVQKHVSLSVQKKPLRTVLYILFGDAVEVKQREGFVILVSKTAKVREEQKMIVFSGYVYNEDGSKLAYASILNRNEQKAAVTNQFGFYKIEVAASRLPLDLKIEKENYEETVQRISAKQTSVDIVLASVEKPVPFPVAVKETPVIKKEHTEKRDTIVPVPVLVILTADTPALSSPNENFVDRFFLSDETKANIRNLKDTLFSRVQLSLIPQVSTNRLLVGNTVNDVSVSALVGYSKEIRLASVAGLVNAVSGDVKYFQAAGLVNAVSGNVKGGQAAGIMNIVDGSFTGGQAAGIGNIVRGSMKGGHAGGLFNVTEGRTDGAQIAGLFNIADSNIAGSQIGGLFNMADIDVNGAQVAGLANITEGNVTGFQVAGLCNIVEGNVAGKQIGGLLNIVGGNVTGSQLAGMMNLNDGDIEGFQLSGFMNDARHVKGMQLSLLNFSDSCSGIAFGLLSFSNKGYHKLELFGDEVMPLQLAFRTGIPKFHNIFIAGFDLSNRIDGLWNFGYGFGASFKVAEKWNINTDLVSQVLLQNDRISKGAQLNSVVLGIERSFGRNFSVVIGPAFRMMFSQSDDTQIADLATPYSFTGDSGLRTWVGGKLAVRFF